jgi:hypothetical protein
MFDSMVTQKHSFVKPLYKDLIMILVYFVLYPVLDLVGLVLILQVLVMSYFMILIGILPWISKLKIDAIELVKLVM